MAADNREVISLDQVQESLTRLHLVLNPNLVSRFYPVLQAGFFVEVRLGQSILELLSGQLGLHAAYVHERISTVFLDGKPVDDICTATIRRGSRLALSSAMPGLVGATMRRGGFYASLRSTITHREQGVGIGQEEMDGIIHVKLFNIIMEELGPLFLRRGIYLQTATLKDLLAGQADHFFTGIKSADLDGRPIDPASFKAADWPAGHEWVHLVIEQVTE